jgi:hypothetical protein
MKSKGLPVMAAPFFDGQERPGVDPEMAIFARHRIGENSHFWMDTL